MPRRLATATFVFLVACGSAPSRAVRPREPFTGTGRVAPANPGNLPSPERRALRGDAGALVCNLQSGPLPPRVRDAVHDALAAEWHADRQTSAFARRFWPLFPGVDRVRHDSAWLLLVLAAHGEEAPWPVAGEIFVASTPRLACAVAAETERSLVARYELALRLDLPTDVRCVFDALRSRSMSRNLPVLEACQPGGP